MGAWEGFYDSASLGMKREKLVMLCRWGICVIGGEDRWEGRGGEGMLDAGC
jgi:hypothetical protein